MCTFLLIRCVVLEKTVKLHSDFLFVFILNVELREESFLNSKRCYLNFLKMKAPLSKYSFYGRFLPFSLDTISKFKVQNLPLILVLLILYIT